jgi:hypothetical protein
LISVSLEIFGKDFLPLGVGNDRTIIHDLNNVLHGGYFILFGKGYGVFIHRFFHAFSFTLSWLVMYIRGDLDNKTLFYYVSLLMFFPLFVIGQLHRETLVL